ncbi:MAG: hypothetical protein ACRDYZ_16615 [Acidimicrobiales bacterium]
MDDRLDVSPSGSDAAFLAACVDQDGDGVELSYRALDRIAERLAADDLTLLVRPDGLGPQLFVRGRGPVAPPTTADLAARPAGFYEGAAPVADAVAPVLVRTCELALAAAAARQRAAGADGGLSGRQFMELAIARAAASSARYGWSHTALLLAAADPGAAPTWAELGDAVASAARVGDEVGAAWAGCAVALLGNAGADAVPPFLERVRAALGATGRGRPQLEVVTVGMPRETVDPRQVWRLLTERLAARVPPAPGGWSGSLPSELELDLRAMPGVLSVGTTGRGLAERPQLTLVASEPTDALHQEAGCRLAERLGDGAVPLVTVGPATIGVEAPNGTLPAFTGDDVRGPSDGPATPFAPAAGARGSNGHPPSGDPAYPPPSAPAHAPAPIPAQDRDRVALLGARFDAATGTSEVVLARGDIRASARAAGGPLAGGAQATLTALSILGIQVPYSLRSAGRMHEVRGAPVVVVLAPRPAVSERGSAMVERMGVAAGGDEVEAAGRATLGALNRYLGDVVPAEPRP